MKLGVERFIWEELKGWDDELYIWSKHNVGNSQGIN